MASRPNVQQTRVVAGATTQGSDLEGAYCGAGLGVVWRGNAPGPGDLNSGVFSQLNSLSSVPVHVLEGEFDYEPPMQLLDEFFNDLKKISPSSELTVVNDGMHGTSDAEKLLFPWLVQFENSKAGDHFSGDLKQAVSKVE